MIHHLSVAARDPKQVANFFAELMGGFAVPFPPNPGSYMSFAGDRHGTGVEIYPADSVMLPNGEDGAIFSRLEMTSPRSPTHFALSVARSGPQVMEMARARGWDCYTCDRGGHFHVTEVWVENSWLVEVLPPDFAEEYLRFTREMETLADRELALEAHKPQSATLERV